MGQWSNPASPYETQAAGLREGRKEEVSDVITHVSVAQLLKAPEVSLEEQPNPPYLVEVETTGWGI